MNNKPTQKPKYLSWGERTLNNADPAEIEKAYSEGYVATRLGKSKFQQTRSVRINLKKFTLSSENRRILKKTEPLTLKTIPLPIEAANYDWHIHKIGSDFYSKKFGDGIFSANKIKSLLTDQTASNFTTLFTYNISGTARNISEGAAAAVGYCIALETPRIIHYSYPFYNLNEAETPAQDTQKVPKDIGMGMMVRAVEYAATAGKDYIYLGSLQRPGDVYKLQFEGIEWFNGKDWSSNIEEAKTILKNE